MIDTTPYPVPLFHEPTRKEYGYDGEVQQLVLRPDPPDSIIEILGLRFFNPPHEYWLCQALVGDKIVAPQRIDVAAYNMDGPQPWHVEDRERPYDRGEPPPFIRVPSWPVVSDTVPLILEVQVQGSPSIVRPLSGVCVVRPVAPPITGYCPRLG